jgi:uncharacterized protein YyaL (SSP411 family)
MKNTKPNLLIHETSPYLQQHSHNPVQWFPWGPLAINKAQKENKLIFLSIGYSACHWCHVMEKESFENEDTAKILNENFISIKVDKEERPDVDAIYMSAVQLLTHSGGWPLTIFLTPDLKPFYGGTYFPLEDKRHLPSFGRVLLGLVNAWKTQELEVKKNAEELTKALVSVFEPPKEKNELTKEILATTLTEIKKRFDNENGGFGTAPKFFHTQDLLFCLQDYKENKTASSLFIVEHTLQKIASGGIYDHLAGGFHRYSTDAKWLAPHFEKMLYDNALLAEVYLKAFEQTSNSFYSKIAFETLHFICKDMQNSTGGFFSTIDADSEGEEGKYYVWSKDEIDSVLGAELSSFFTELYSISEEGNWEGKNILHFNSPRQNLNEDSYVLCKRKLLEERKQRRHPHIDTKMITSWNGMMIHAMALGYQILQEETFLEAAENAANFILKSSELENLKHSFKDGKSQNICFLEDYAFLANAFMTLSECKDKEAWMNKAKVLLEIMIRDFYDDKKHIFYMTSKQEKNLLVKPTDVFDGATPSSTAMAAVSLLRFNKKSKNENFAQVAKSIFKNYSNSIKTMPQGFGTLLGHAKDLLPN